MPQYDLNWWTDYLTPEDGNYHHALNWQYTYEYLYHPTQGKGVDNQVRLDHYSSELDEAVLQGLRLTVDHQTWIDTFIINIFLDKYGAKSEPSEKIQMFFLGKKAVKEALQTAFRMGNIFLEKRCSILKLMAEAEQNVVGDVYQAGPGHGWSMRL